MNLNPNIDPCSYEPEILHPCLDIVGKHCEMSSSDKYFLSGLLRMCKPEKVLEIGVSSGGSSAIILNALQGRTNAKLYSVEYAKNAYKYPDKQAGFLVFEKFPNLLPDWQLFTGGTFAKFFNDIPTDCDFCLLDTSHSLPGECLDFLLVYPHLSKSAVVCIHDINLHFLRLLEGKNIKGVISSCLLFNCLNGNKILSRAVEYPVSTIGAVQLNEITEQCIDSIFSMLSLPWTYMPKDEDLCEISEFILHHYSKKRRDFFLLCVKAQRIFFN